MSGQLVQETGHKIDGLMPYSSSANPRFGETLSDVALDFLSDTKEKRSEGTYAKYEAIYSHYLADALGKMRLADLSNGQLKMLRDDLLSRHPDLSHSMVRTIFIVLNKTIGMVNERYATDFVELKHGLPANVLKQEYEVFCADDQKRLLGEFYKKVDTCKLAMICSLYLGLNIGEFSRLKWDDIDLAKGVMKVQRPKVATVRRSVNRDVASGMSTREIPLTDHMKILLRSYGCPHGYVFAFKTGGKVVGRTIQYHFDDVKNMAGVADMSLSFKALRFTFIANCRAMGIDFDTVSALCGYAGSATALKYNAEVSMAAKINCIEKIERYYEDLRLC